MGGFLVVVGVGGGCVTAVNLLWGRSPLLEPLETSCKNLHGVQMKETNPRRPSASSSASVAANGGAVGARLRGVAVLHGLPAL